MEIGDWPTAGHLPGLYRELRQLGLEPNMAELHAFGYTVLTPQQVGAPGLRERVLEAVLEVSERRSGVRPDMGAGDSHRGMVHPLGQLMRFLLWESQVFEELLLNPPTLGLASWLIGPDCILSLCNAMLRGPGDNAVGVHTDEGVKTIPLHGHEPLTVNATYLLTDYTREGGALGFIPGSHRWRREPTPAEIEDKQHLVPIEAPAGSMVIWGSHTWHASFPRTIAGLRGTAFMVFARYDLQTQEPYRDTCTQAALDRNPKRFAVLMDQFGICPFREEDYDMERLMQRHEPHSLFDRTPTQGSVRLRSTALRRGVPAATQPVSSPLVAAPQG